LAVAGLFRRNAREFVIRHAYLAAITTALPFVVALYSGESSLYEGFLLADVPRVLLYALPLYLPLAAWAVEPLLGRSQPRAAGGPRPWLERGAWAVTVAGLVAMPFALDGYRRVEPA